MTAQIIAYEPSLVQSSRDTRLQVESIRNPILRDMANKYNLALDGVSLPDVLATYSKGSHTRHTKGGSGGGCFLTTACVDARGLPDDCLELTTLRSFRDKILMPSAMGKKMVGEYYRIAPEIVETVNSFGNSSEIWNGVYLDVQRAVSLVSRGEFNKAFEHYKDMTTKLKRKYLG